MKETIRVKNQNPRRKRRMSLGVKVTLVLLFVAATGATGLAISDLGATQPKWRVAKVEHRDLAVDVVSSGRLESQFNTLIRSEVQDVRGDGAEGIQIISLIPNGTKVKKGDLLARLDTTSIREILLDTQVLETEEARTLKLKADVVLANRITQNETQLAQAHLKVELSELELKMYTDGDDGTYQIAIQELRLRVEEAQNQILEAQAALEMNKVERSGTELLHKLGYRGQGEMRQSMLGYLRAEDNLVRATNKLRTSRSSQVKLEKYEGPMQKRQLEGALSTARNALSQTKLDNQSFLERAQDNQFAATQRFEKEQELLERYEDQITKCEIFAPHDGIAVHAQPERWEEPIREGAYVDERQRILALPDLTKMQIATFVHETQLFQVDESMPATIQVEGNDQVFRGTVKTINFMPNQQDWFEGDVKNYETKILIDGDVDGLKPGMTAIVKIHINNLNDALCVPIESIVSQSGERCCWLKTPDGIESRPVEIGLRNDTLVQVIDGLEIGEEVITNPSGLSEPNAESM